VGGGLSEWAPPKQQLQSPPNVGRLLSAFAQRPLAAALDVGASRPQAGGEELLLAAAQVCAHRCFKLGYAVLAFLPACPPASPREGAPQLWPAPGWVPLLPALLTALRQDSG
jgi:hypothetical protein